MSPRRSSRARTTQPSPALLQHTNSSGSSVSLNRERSTRSNHKNPSPQGSSTHRSQSIDDGENGSRTDLPQTRQRQRARDDDDEPPREEDEDDMDDDEEEEVTRCLCGQQDYPGLPLSRREALGRSIVKPEPVHPPTDSSDLMSDDIGSMFIQCDLCKVWQHGGCVGIMDEETSPDEYFCEECRKDLHRIRGEANGSRSSTYLPVAPPPPPPAPPLAAAASSPAPSSRASSHDSSRRSKDPKSRKSEDAANTKRRSTMNSRDAAYDEEELIRRAIEESKEDTKSLPDDTSTTRRGKRSRSASEANRQGVKRQRTASPSPAAASKHSNTVSQPPSDDESNKAKSTNGTGNGNGNGNGTRRQRATSRGQRDKEPPKTDEAPIETETVENGLRRKKEIIAVKLNCTESEQEPASPTKPAAPPAPEPEQQPAQPSPNTPTPQEPTPARPSTRKSGRPPARRGRVGRNQYTKDRDVNGTGTGTESPRRGYSHDIGADSPRVGHGANGTQINGGDTGRPSKPRHMHPQRTTMNEMKRRVAAILEFISRMQVEMAVASENSSTPTGNGDGDRAQGLLLKSMVDQINSAMPSTISDAGESAPTDAGDNEKDFKDLSSLEMMDVLTRHLLKWQQEYGKFGER
ncbi:Zinc finger PHD-type [Penicillium angulare]|uniref:Zinc finger PHD-type n=1 Tax=Penicillium angulare TaxID=116970 RepID=A0A9W9FHY2_9EURO|nr:Zinc finger PHD-type [Penicillium angulare]